MQHENKINIAIKHNDISLRKMKNFWNVFISISIWILGILLCLVFLRNCSRPQFFTVSMADTSLTKEIVEQKGIVDWSQLTVDSLNIVHLVGNYDTSSYKALRNRILREEVKAGRLMTAEEMSEKITGYYDKLIDVLIALFILFSFASYFVINNRFRKQYEDDKNAFSDTIKQSLMQTLPFDSDLVNGIVTKMQNDIVTEDKIQELREKIQKNNDDFALLAKAYDELTEKADSKMEIEDVDRTATSNNKNQQEGGVQ